jgi:hypothetical protein
MRSAQLAHQGGGNCRRSHSVIPPEDSAGRGSIAHPARDIRTCDPIKTKNQNQEKPSYERKNKNHSMPSRWSGKSKVRLRKDLTKSLHELPLAR